MGQGAMLYEQRVSMRPDWEHVVPGLLDALSTHPEVDPDKIVLVGRSFGGYLAPRGAAGEPRLAAMIADPGQHDIGAATARFGDLRKRVHDPAADQEFNALLTIPAVKALLAPRMVTHGVSSVRAYCADLLRYTNADTITRVTCPSYVTDNETDVVSTGQGKELFITSPAPRTSACSPGPRAPKATARAWRRSYSGPRPSTGSMR
jgi:pimeloyl-ACP methyl ester carboxylesterase